MAQTSTDAAYLARHASLRAGVDISAPALTLNRLCGSGFQAVVSAAQEIQLGEASVALVGGTESMSQAPLAAWGDKVRFSNKMLGKDLTLQDTLWSALTDAYVKLPMAITAENLAEKYDISREECDEFALRSQHTWGAAHEAGVFASEIAPMELKGRKGPEVMDADGGWGKGCACVLMLVVHAFSPRLFCNSPTEHARPQTTPEGLAKLPAVFKKGGVVTAGNASGICDGAAALVLASEAAVKEHGFTPLARLVSYSVAGVDPSIMGCVLFHPRVACCVLRVVGCVRPVCLTVWDCDVQHRAVPRHPASAVARREVVGRHGFGGNQRSVCRPGAGVRKGAGH